MRFLSGVLFGLLIGCGTSAAMAQTATPARLAEAERVIDAEAAKLTSGSMTVAIVADGKTVFVKSYGFRDGEGRVPATPDTVYRIGSITKPFTGFALLSLEAEGRLRLTDPAVMYVPELGPVAGNADLLTLATHRAGLAREPEDPAPYWTGRIDRWQDIARDALRHTKALFPPGEGLSYSNIGYAALGLAIEKASGISYTDYVEDRILRPLDMTSTSFTPDADMLERLARGQGADAGRAETELKDGRGYRIPNGGLFTTTPDLARFLAFEMGAIPHPLLDKEALTANADRTFFDGDRTRYGIGFFAESHGDRTLMGHNGGVAGYAASAFYGKIGIVCLASTQAVCRQRFFAVYAVFVPEWATVAEGARAAAKPAP